MVWHVSKCWLRCRLTGDFFPNTPTAKCAHLDDPTLVARAAEVVKQRRVHLDTIERDAHGNFKNTGGPGSEGGKERKPENRTDSRNGEPPPKGKGKGKEAESRHVGAISHFSRTEQMHRVLPKKPKKAEYVTSHTPSATKPARA